MTRTIRETRGDQLQGGHAGFVSRIAANAIDLLVVQGIYVSILVGVAVVRFLLNRNSFTVSAPDLLVTVIAQWSILVLYLGTNWSSTGRTIGKSVMGLRVGNRSGATLRPIRAFMRAVFCASFYPSLLWILVSPRNAALHDAVLRTQVVYDWHSGAGAPAEAT